MRFGRARIIWGSKYRWLSVLLISLGASAFECAYFAYTMSILESSSRQHASLSDQIHAGIAVLVLLFIYILLVSVFVQWLQKRDLAKQTQLASQGLFPWNSSPQDFMSCHFSTFFTLSSGVE